MKNKWSILYVDDDFDGCQLIPIWLSNNGEFVVTAVEDGNEAALIIEHKEFDLYLLDYCIPDVTGVALCKQIRRIHPDAPVIFYSALERDVDREMAAEAGADLFLVKPDDLGLIVPSVERFLKGDPDQASSRTTSGTFAA